jgi:hypothetical protein
MLNEINLINYQAHAQGLQSPQKNAKANDEAMRSKCGLRATEGSAACGERGGATTTAPIRHSRGGWAGEPARRTPHPTSLRQMPDTTHSCQPPASRTKPEAHRPSQQPAGRWQRVRVKPKSKFYETPKSGLGKAEGVPMSRDEQRAVQQASTRKQRVNGRPCFWHEVSGPPSPLGQIWGELEGLPTSCFLRCWLFKQGGRRQQHRLDDPAL